MLNEIIEKITEFDKYKIKHLEMDENTYELLEAEAIRLFELGKEPKTICGNKIKISNDEGVFIVDIFDNKKRIY